LPGHDDAWWAADHQSANNAAAILSA
jgi:hypothetical protein